MKEYTICALISALLVMIADRRLNTRVLRRGSFWLFFGVMISFKTLVNGYLTWRPIVTYGESSYLGFRLGTIPLEDFVYGFSLITLSVVVWEFLRKDKTK